MGSIEISLKVIWEMLNKVRAYFLKKLMRPSNPKRQMLKEDDQKKRPIPPLFQGMSLPPQSQVGLLLPLKCGHNGRPNNTESINLEMHLEASGIFKANPIDPEDLDLPSFDAF